MSTVDNSIGENTTSGTFAYTIDTADTGIATYTYPATVTNDPNHSGTVISSNPPGNVIADSWSWSVQDPPMTTESLREMLGLPAEGCIVCSTETDGLLCPLCVQAINEAREKIVKEMVGTMLTDMKKGKSVSKKKFHVAYTLTGTRTHAVEFFGGGRYDSQALCGVSGISPSRTRFARVKNDNLTCSNCAYIYRIRGYEG